MLDFAPCGIKPILQRPRLVNGRDFRLELDALVGRVLERNPANGLIMLVLVQQYKRILEFRAQ